MALSGIPGSRNDTKQQGQPPEALTSMVEPDIGARLDSGAVGTQTLAPQEELKDAESVNGGAFEPPKLQPLVPSELKDDASPDPPASEDVGGGGGGGIRRYAGCCARAVLWPWAPAVVRRVHGACRRQRGRCGLDYILRRGM